jgi:hypothetical protein
VTRLKFAHKQELSHLRDIDASDLGELGMTKVQIKRFIRVRDSGGVDASVNDPNIQKVISRICFYNL